MARRPVVSIVGCGRAGGAIGLALSRNGYEIAAAWSRSRSGRQRAHRLLNVPVLTSAEEVARLGDVVIVAVPDDAIKETSQAIAGGIRAERVAVHTSGGASIKALAAVEDVGARVASLHPLQTLPDATRGADALRGAAVAVTCDPRDWVVLYRLARAWGGRPFALPDEAKPVYHAAAVFASNYLTTAIWASVSTLESIGVGNARQLIDPLVRASVENALARGPGAALTGPVARGDAETVRAHVQALRTGAPSDGRVAEAYAAFARLTAFLAGGDTSAIDKATA